MCQKYTANQLNTMSHDTKNEVIYQMQECLDKLEHDYENLLEQIRLAKQERFGRHTEKLDDLVGQLSFFNEAEFCYNENAKEPTMEETVDEALKKPRRPKKKGQREEDLKDFPQEIIPHDVSEKSTSKHFRIENPAFMQVSRFFRFIFNHDFLFSGTFYRKFTLKCPIFRSFLRFSLSPNLLRVKYLGS